MKKDKRKNNKKLLIILISVIIVISIVLLISTSLNKKNYSVSEVEKTFTTYYSDINLESLSYEDITYYFSLPVTVDEHALLLSNFNPNEELTEDIKEPNLLLLITDLDKAKLKEYYDSIEGFIGSYIKKYDEQKDNKLINLYNDSVLKKGKDYLYVIIGTKNTEFEEELNRLYK